MICTICDGGRTFPHALTIIITITNTTVTYEDISSNLWHIYMFYWTSNLLHMTLQTFIPHWHWLTVTFTPKAFIHLFLSYPLNRIQYVQDVTKNEIICFRDRLQVLLGLLETLCCTFWFRPHPFCRFKFVYKYACSMQSIEQSRYIQHHYTPNTTRTRPALKVLI